MKFEAAEKAAILIISLITVLYPTLSQQQSPTSPSSSPSLTLTTSAFEDGSIIPSKYTQLDPTSVSPELSWTYVPNGSVTFTLIFHDPDMAGQKKAEDNLHWMIFNIPGTARSLPEGIPATAKLSDGSIQCRNVRGGIGFLGPGASAAGPYHHYTFELYALDTKLELGPDASRSDVIKAMDGHILGKAVLVGRFHR
jgi:Raf kinase inhibitor-like YbhB/YbcL family protein